MKDSTTIGAAIVLSIALGYFIGAASNARPSLGKNQTMDVVAKRYQLCKAKAPPNMDCTMVAMMVSDAVARELGRTP